MFPSIWGTSEYWFFTGMLMCEPRTTKTPFSSFFIEIPHGMLAKTDVPDLPSHHHHLQYSYPPHFFQLTLQVEQMVRHRVISHHPPGLPLRAGFGHRIGSPAPPRCRQRRDQRRCDQRHPGHGRWWLCGRKGGGEVREVGGWQGVVDSGATERVEDAKVYFFEHQSKETLKEKVYSTWVWPFGSGYSWISS